MAVRAVAAISLALSLASYASANDRNKRSSTSAKNKAGMQQAQMHYDAISFDDLPGWADDDHLAAFKAFRKSCKRVLKAISRGHRSDKKPPSPGLLSACFHAEELARQNPSQKAAKSFFESHFAPHRVLHNEKPGLLTGYYEPVIAGSRKQTEKFRAPVFRRPLDLVNLVDESQRGAVDGKQLTHVRKWGQREMPYPTREEIESGALKDMNLELLYLEDPVDVFFMQIQGSGRIRLPDGQHVRVTYDGKNGHPYTSVGQYLISNNIFPAHRMSLDALADWLKADQKRGQQVMWQNKSYVFFREIAQVQDEGPLGVMQIPLTEGRSLAVDGGYHAIGMPVYVSAPEIKHVVGDSGFHRLMVAQDVGSAIKGPERGDIYFGSGKQAGKLAGVTKHPGTFYVLLPALHDGDQLVAGETTQRTVRQAQR